MSLLIYGMRGEMKELNYDVKELVFAGWILRRAGSALKKEICRGPNEAMIRHQKACKNQNMTLRSTEQNR